MRIRNPRGAVDRLSELVANLKEINDASVNNENHVELSRIDWICPVTFLPIVAYASYKSISIVYTGGKLDIITYLNAICFPAGTSELANIRKDYLPITRVCCSDNRDILGEYEDRILIKLPQNQRQGALSGLKYLTSELEANVREHAQVDDYWVFAQYWERSGVCEIGICDMGIGYKQSYMGTPFQVDRHLEAIINALEGKSSKSSSERGSGIPTIARILDEGYRGQFIIMSGDSILVSDQGKRTGYKFKNPNLVLPGSFVGLRFGLRAINIYDYIV